MNIIHISGARSWGGNEQQLIDLIPELENLGVQNTIFGVPGTPLAHYCIKNNINFITAKNDKLKNKKNYKFLKEIVQSNKPDLLHLHTSDSLTVFTIADLLYKLKTPTVFSKKGMGRSMSFLSLLKYNYRNISKIICVSEAVKIAMENDVMKKKNHSKLVVVYDGINSNRLKNVANAIPDLRKKYEVSKDSFLIGNIANHVPAKDLSILLKAMRELVYELNFKKVHLIQIGAFSKITEELKSLKSELELENYFTFTDFQENATDFFPQFDCYVMSSEREGLPLTVYEAFYKKVPIVSTKAGGIPEVISDGENGFLAEVKDYKVLAQKMKMLLENPKLQNQFKEKSYDLFCDKFDADKTAEATLEIYKTVISEK